MADGIIFERIGGVARITLNRPDVGNALDMPVTKALLEIAIACDQDPSIRCVLLTGTGKMFCAGGDITFFSTAGDRLPALMKELTAYLHGAVATFARMNKPIVTAVNGAAAGAGLSLAILGDIVLAAPEAQFAVAYTGIGLSPDGGATWLLPRLVGLRRAQELMLRNTRVKAEEAVAIGLATRVAESSETFADEALALATELANGPTSALGATRRLLLDSFVNSLETQMELEGRAISANGGHPDGKEGVAAFLAKRKPVFGG